MYLICKALYIAIFALLSAAPPYLPLYYHDVLGFSSDQIGFVLAIAPFIQSIACPLWTYTVDKRPALHGPIMAVTSLIGGSAIMFIMVIGNSVSSDIVNPTQIFSALKLQLSNSSLVLVTSVLALTFAFFTLPNLSLVDSAVMKILGPHKILYGEQRLWGSASAGLTILIVGQIISMTDSLDGLFWVFGASTLLFIVFACFVNVSNSSEYQHLPQNADQDADLERVPSDGRLLSQVITDSSEKLLKSEGHRVPIKGYNSINHSNSHYVDLFKPNSVTSAHTIREEADETLEAIGGLDLGLAISRIASVDQSMIGIVHLDSDGIPSSSIFKSVRVMTFLITTLLFGFVLSMIVNFLFLFLSRDLMMPASWIGWTGPTTGVTELLCFCFSKQLTEIFGVTNMILIAHVATIIRCLFYTVLTPDSFFTNVSALSLQTLHGVGFGIFWATSVSEMDGFFPPEQRSVAQGILGALHFGLGAGLGALSGGYLYEYMGSIWMFRIGALVATINMVIFYVGRLDRFK
ncbi:major facilitator superfamily domain-containing protein [Thamnidium elegans]|nr:major facilitator superfamily domain-containing protein [Thamnidium elegans]